MPEIRGYRRKLDRLLAQHDQAAAQVHRERQALKEAKGRVKTLLQAQQIVQVVAESVQKSAHAQIASVVTRCLQAVFGEEAYVFKIHFERKRGKTEARLVFERDGQDRDPLDATGGGVVDVAAFALRLACLVLTRPQRRQLLCLDEPFRHLSREYRPAVRELLQVLAKEMHVQFVIVTHAPDLACGKVVEL